MFTVCSRGCKIGGAFVSNFANQKIDGARLGCVVIKLPKVVVVERVTGVDSAAVVGMVQVVDSVVVVE